MDLLLPLILAAVLTVALIPVLERRAGVLHVMDAPGERKVHDHPIPRVGGIAMAVGAAVAFALWLPLNQLSLAYMAGALVVLLFGVWDDRSDLRPSFKLLGQLLAASIVVFVGGVEIHSITLTSRIELPQVLSLPLTFLFLVGVTNAINLADGLDGLAGGTTLLCFAAIVALTVGHDAPFVAIVACGMIGSLLGFLRFNTFPARVFMGDGGSQLLGFTAGVLAVALTQDAEMPYSAALPVLLLGLPILDTLTVMVRRVVEGRSPFSADDRHLHHRLLARGFDHFESVALIYLLQALLFVLAWFMRHQSDFWILAAFGGFAMTVLFALYVGKQTNWQWRAEAGTQLGAWVALRLPWLKAPSHLPRWANVIAWCCFAVYLLGTALTTTAVSKDVAWLALGLALLLLMARFRLGPANVAERIAHGSVFVVAVMGVYLDHIEPTKTAAFVAAKWVLFPVLVIAVVMRLRFWRERRFEITTLDVLVVFLALVLPNLPGLQQGPSNLGLSVLKLVALLYAIEMLLGHSARVRRWTWSISAAGLVVLALRGLSGLNS
jgi:UDP-GlcNAc:undecaprenyl-phosphate/decaprenyl-phosphate GlcNAc-1-phosphate transferase